MPNKNFIIPLLDYYVHKNGKSWCIRTKSLFFSVEKTTSLHWKFITIELINCLVKKQSKPISMVHLTPHPPPKREISFPLHIANLSHEACFMLLGIWKRIPAPCQTQAHVGEKLLFSSANHGWTHASSNWIGSRFDAAVGKEDVRRPVCRLI